MEYNLNNYPNDYPNNHSGKPNKDNKQNENSKNNFLRGLLTGFLLCFLLACGLFTGRQLYSVYQMKSVSKTLQATSSDVKELVNDQSMQKLKVIEEAITDYYYQEDVDTQNMINGMYEGVVASLGDPYSTYYTEEDVQKLMDETEGIYYGIGAYVGMDKETGRIAQIRGVIDNTPAQEAGLREGDIIYKVDDEDVQGLELTDIVSKIKGPEGTTVHLTLYREGESDYIEVDVERKKIESPTVSYDIYDNIGYIQITEFDDITVDQFTEAMAVLRGKEMQGLILDLRSNPGGNLSTVTEIAKQMLPKGLIVYTEDREGNRTEYSSDGSKEFDLPLVVLINGYSASASEILAGAIKDYEMGELVGTTTFGKGIVQRVLSLSDGTAIKLTVSTYFTPKGNNIHGLGIEPDEICEFDGDQDNDNQLERAKEIIKEKIIENNQ